ncbi:MAG: 3-oxoacyl-[acyl-carrier-protein] synthase III C-terminal domain-containing protein [Calothrix sp. MO_167.B12]|nr:3-oxoacyl-[acyl-carrier-protein] synthase III C-terminal domain-containing protein [Calothrix sp. MO_167.B12]
MQEQKKVYLTAISYELGDFHSIKEIDELKEKPQVLETLLTLGLEKYSKSYLTTLEMAKKSALATLEKTKISAKNIDLLIYASYSFWDLESPGFIEIGRLIDELGLENAYPIGTFLSGCGNLQTALRMATNFIQSEECKNILIITVDRFSEKQSRIVQPNVSVLSDAAASCLLTSSEVKGEFEILCTSQNMDATISSLDPNSQSLEILEKITDGTYQAFEKALKTTGKEAKDIRTIITNNYNISVTKSLCASLGFDIYQAYTKNISRFAHASAADNIINLSDFALENSLLSNDLILLLGTGPSTWGCSILSKNS